MLYKFKNTNNFKIYLSLVHESFLRRNEAAFERELGPFLLNLKFIFET